VTGEDCYFMKLHVRDVLHLEEVIDRFALYGQTTTSIIQSSPVPVRGVALATTKGGSA
jgi:Lrp/AsnC family transcriptional regulator, leucine-responsive regulatory protein